jgi:hypothetical protein
MSERPSIFEITSVRRGEVRLAERSQATLDVRRARPQASIAPTAGRAGSVADGRAPGSARWVGRLRQA